MSNFKAGDVVRTTSGKRGLTVEYGGEVLEVRGADLVCFFGPLGTIRVPATSCTVVSRKADRGGVEHREAAEKKPVRTVTKKSSDGDD